MKKFFLLFLVLAIAGTGKPSSGPLSPGKKIEIKKQDVSPVKNIFFISSSFLEKEEKMVKDYSIFMLAFFTVWGFLALMEKMLDLEKPNST